MKKLDISVLLATHKRNEILRITLDSFVKLETSTFSYEIIVIDNAGEKETYDLVMSYEKHLPINYLEELIPGKNAAINTGLKKASGEILVFTDDDIVADPEWLKQIYAGVHRHPDAHLFGGKILPFYPANHLSISKHLDFNHWFLRSAYVIADWDQDEGAIRVGHIWGPNMTIKRTVFERGLIFNPDIGPNGKDYVMGAETEFLYRAADMGFKSIYLPNAIVKHQIRTEQLSLTWIKNRAFRTGKGKAALEKSSHKNILGVPLFLWKKYFIALLKQYICLCCTARYRFDNLINLNIIKGQVKQYTTQHLK